MSTWIKVHRGLLESDVFANPFTLKVWIWVLIKATFKDKVVSLKTGKGYRDIPIKRGQFVFGRNRAESSLEMDASTIYRHIKKLEAMKNILIESNNQYSIITVCNYDDYQDKENEYEQPTNNQRTANEQPTNTNNNDKNNKEEINNNKGAIIEIKNNVNMVAVAPMPPQVNGFNYLPDGRSYIEPTVFFKKEDFSDLPKDNIVAIVGFFSSTKQVSVSEDQIRVLWDVFKIQELTEQKPYRNKADVYRHFLNWSKKQTFSRAIKPKNTKNESVQTSDKTVLNLQNVANRYD